MTILTQKDIERFWGYIDKENSAFFYNNSRCWTWKLRPTKGGYGKIKIFGRTMLSHRIPYELSFGKIPVDFHVLHHCDNPPCCNPAHLFLGTQQDNMNDMYKKGRSRSSKGEKNGNSKLSDIQVENIRSQYTSGEITQTSLAKKYGVLQAQIQRIIKHKSRT